MSIDLLDVNVLLALGWSEHEAHDAARNWFRSRLGKPWATSAMTECGFVRIASNRKMTPGASTVAVALEGLRTLRQLPGHQFWATEASPADEPLFDRLEGHRQITDVQLLAMAQRHSGRLVTFDKGLAAFAAANGIGAHLVLLSS